MFFHQTANSIGNQIYNAFLYREVFWNLHLHRSFEVCLVTAGSVRITVENREEILKAGDCVLIPPYVPHAYCGDADSVCFIAVFSGSYVSGFDALAKSRRFLSYRFSPDAELRSYFAKNMGFANLPSPLPKDRISVPTPDVFTLKACLYAIVSAFQLQVPYQERKKETDLLYQILSYMQEHFTEDISLGSLCRELGYNYEYISKIFNQSLGINFKTLLNQYRCERANELMESGEKSLSEIAFESGFQSIRTFNRVFRDFTGHPPSASDSMKKG